MTDNLPNDEKLVSIGEASRILGVSIDTVRRWDKAGMLHSTRQNGKNRIFSVAELLSHKETKLLSIGRVSKELGLSASKLRRLEAKGLIKPGRDANGERTYDKGAIDEFLHSAYFTDKKRKPKAIRKLIEESSLPPQTAPLQSRTFNFKDIISDSNFAAFVIMIIVTVGAAYILFFQAEDDLFGGYLSSSVAGETLTAVLGYSNRTFSGFDRLVTAHLPSGGRVGKVAVSQVEIANNNNEKTSEKSDDTTIKETKTQAKLLYINSQLLLASPQKLAGKIETVTTTEINETANGMSNLLGYASDPVGEATIFGEINWFNKNQDFASLDEIKKSAVVIRNILDSNPQVKDLAGLIAETDHLQKMVGEGLIAKMNDLFAEAKADEIPPMERKKVVIGKTPNGWLRVRNKPNGAEIAKVNSGEIYDLVEANTGWYLVEVPDGPKGWISSQYSSVQ